MSITSAACPAPQPSKPSLRSLIRPRPYRTVNIDWLARCATLPGRTANAGLAIWALVLTSNTTNIAITQATFKRFGVSREASYEALTRLQAARLLHVDRQRGRAARVTLLGTDGQALVLPTPQTQQADRRR